MKVSISVKTTALGLVQNPVNDKIILKALKTPSGQFDYTIQSAGGQVVQTGNTTLQTNSLAEISFKQNMKAGVYSLTLNQGATLVSLRFVVL